MRAGRFFIFIIAALIACIGISSIYGSTSQRGDRLWQEFYKRQILWVALGAILFFAVSGMNYRYLWDWTYLLYAANLFFLFLVYALGVTRLGAQRWLKIAWFNFQPSELAKLILAIFLARYFSKKTADDIRLASGRFGIFKGIILPFLILAIPVGLIIEQPDLGSGTIIVILFMFVLYITDVKLRYLFISLLIGAIFLPFSWQMLRPYQKERLLVFLNPNIDPLGAGYTVIQSKIAIGSGGWFGKGWLSGTQSQLRFLPESHTDFIFASFTEQWGFFGGMALLFLYYLLIRQGLIIASRTNDHFGRLLAFGISLMLAIQVFVNIAMNLGLAPVVGLPLPLMSYGGSSVMVTFIALGILAGIDKRRAVF